MYAERTLGQAFCLIETPSFLNNCRALNPYVNAVLNAKERDADEWATLLAKAEPQMDFLGVRKHP